AAEGGARSGPPTRHGNGEPAMQAPAPASREASPGSRVAARRPVWRVDNSAVPQSCVTVPPAAVIFAPAVAEKACALTRHAAPASPLPSTLTSSPARTAPLAARLSGVTSPPSG